MVNDAWGYRFIYERADAGTELLAVCIANQQEAGFGKVLDVRKFKCPDCGSAGFNTGWGFTRYTCAAEILSDGTSDEPCSEPIEALESAAMGWVR